MTFDPGPATRPGLVLFDLDGTLTDPAEGIVRSLEMALATIGRSLPAEPFDLIGPPFQDSLAELGLDHGEIETVLAAYRTRYREVGMFENRVYDGVPDMLATLVDRGCVLALATSKPEAFAEPILEHFGIRHHFRVVAGATLSGSRRLKADVIAHALGQLPALARQAAVMVGDRYHDVAGAAAYRLPTIGVTWGYGTRAELEAAGAWRIAETPAAVAAVIG